MRPLFWSLLALTSVSGAARAMEPPAAPETQGITFAIQVELGETAPLVPVNCELYHSDGQIIQIHTLAICELPMTPIGNESTVAEADHQLTPASCCTLLQNAIALAVPYQPARMTHAINSFAAARADHDMTAHKVTRTAINCSSELAVNGEHSSGKLQTAASEARQSAATYSPSPIQQTSYEVREEPVRR